MDEAMNVALVQLFNVAQSWLRNKARFERDLLKWVQCNQLHLLWLQVCLLHNYIVICLLCTNYKQCGMILL